ncbi:M56 family metallopeptidase [Edaphobacter albus]|uniref:M56 family metallopeptidase n=1 Tax=Edaphobacter sp. 4G125 TaxID=2763071 RepID=UPI001648585C|nr:M56 family metallopeptidase [Edaphobacter sp. 4G125]QNI35562.1 M56 family metallopeptidase [Edaphobacter sp. 4G125]
MPSTPLSQFAAEVFTAGLWQGVLVAAVVALSLRLVSRISSSARFIVWGVAFLLIIAVPLLRLQTPGGTGSSAVLHLTPIWTIVILSIWVVLTVFRFAQLLYQARQTHRIWKDASPVSVSPSVLALLQTSGRRAELCTSRDIDSPCVIGFFSPRLLVPESLFAELSQPQLEHIILHECEHLRRYDDWINLAQKIILALFPLNPALWVADRRLSLERELACDAGVIAKTSAPFDYAHSLTRLAEHRLFSSRVALALSAWTHRSELSHRVHALLKPVHQLSPSWTRSAFAALFLILGGGSLMLVHAPRLVSFSSAPVLTASELSAVSVISSRTSSVPVLYHSEAASQPRMTLLKATMPSTRPASAHAKKPALKQNGRSEATSPRTSFQQTPRVVQTKAGSSSTTPSRSHRNTVRAYYITTDFAPSYAAVPFGDGWLIVQL